MGFDELGEFDEFVPGFWQKEGGGEGEAEVVQFPARDWDQLHADSVLLLA